MTYTQKIKVLLGHLEEIYQAVDSAYAYHVSEDLQQKYRNIGANDKPSRLTVALGKALAHIEGYLQEEEDVPEE